MIMLWCILFYVSSCVAHDEEIFLRASDAYNNHNFEQALHLYQTMAKSGPGVWYNQGNCYYCLGDYIHALVAWARAYQSGYAAIMSLVLYNCTVLQQRLGIQHSGMPHNFTVFLLWLLRYHILLWQIVLLGIWYSVLYVIVRYSLKKYWWITLLLGCSGIFLGCLIYTWHVYCCTHWAVTKEGILMRTGPGNHCTQKGLIPRAAFVQVSQQETDWTKVHYETTVGWIPSDSLLKI